MRIILFLFGTLLFLFCHLNAFAQYGEHGKPRMLLIQTNSEVAPPSDDEVEQLKSALQNSSIASAVKMEDFMYSKSSYTFFLKQITPISMPDGYYDDLKAKIKVTFPRATFQEIEFGTAYKWLGKSPYPHKNNPTPSTR